MTNSTKIDSKQANIYSIIIAYYSLSLIIIGTLLNLLTLFILYRPKFRTNHERPTIIYMRTVVITDILMLYGWNLDHYTQPIYHFDFFSYSIISCKLAWLLNYFSAQTSAWLRVLISFDRYMTLRRLHQTWFSRSKSAYILIICVICFFILFNLHLSIFGCYYDINGRIITDSKLYKIAPTLDWINLVMYNCLPFILMVFFNSRIISHLLRIRRTSLLRNSRIHYRTVSITSVITTFLFMIMTIPGTIGFGFFVDTVDLVILMGLDAILFTYHILSFPLFLITFDEFRQEFMKIISWKKNHRRILPHWIPFI